MTPATKRAGSDNETGPAKKPRVATDDEITTKDASVDAPVKKARGRPKAANKKVKGEATDESIHNIKAASDVNEDEAPATPPKKGRGKAATRPITPPKTPKAKASAQKTAEELAASDSESAVLTQALAAPKSGKARKAASAGRTLSRAGRKFTTSGRRSLAKK